MKRLLLSLLTVMFGVAMSFAAEVTIETNATASIWTGAADTGFTTIVNGFEVSYLKVGQTSNLRTPETDHIRVYKDAEFIVTNTSNLNITKMVINTTSDTNTGNMTANTGAVSFDTSAQTITW